MKKICCILGVAIICFFSFCSCGMRHNRNTEYYDLGDINKYSIVASIDEDIVYNYFDKDGNMIIGKYDCESNTYNDICLIEDFYLSVGIPTVIDKKMYYPVTLTNGMHNLYEIDFESNVYEVVFEINSRNPIDYVSSIGDIVYYMTQNDNDNNYYIDAYYANTCEYYHDILRYDLDKENENVIFDCYLDDIYVLEKGCDKSYFINMYTKDGGYVRTYNIASDLLMIFDQGINQFFVVDNYIYIRNYSDYGAILRFTESEVQFLWGDTGIRIVNDFTNKDDKLILFGRETRQIYVWDNNSENVEEISLDLNNDESIRNIVRNNQSLIISVLDEGNEKYFETKTNLRVWINGLVEE